MTTSPELTATAELDALAARLDKLAAAISKIDDHRDEVLTEQHDLIRDLHRKFGYPNGTVAPQLSYRQIGALARMSHQNVALILGWTPPNAAKPKVPAKAKKLKATTRR